MGGVRGTYQKCLEAERTTWEHRGREPEHPRGLPEHFSNLVWFYNIGMLFPCCLFCGKEAELYTSRVSGCDSSHATRTRWHRYSALNAGEEVRWPLSLIIAVRVNKMGEAQLNLCDSRLSVGILDLI